MITLTVNGKSQHLDVEPDTPLREPARDNLGIPAVAYCSPMAMPEGPLPAWFCVGTGHSAFSAGGSSASSVAHGRLLAGSRFGERHGC
jgi:hypothetical protein